MNKLVLFQNLLETEEADIHFGLLTEEREVICLCCGSIFEKEDYKIIMSYNIVPNVSQLLKKHFVKEPEVLQYFEEHLPPNNAVCKRCLQPVLFSELTEQGYKYQCIECDEDLYEFETSEVKNIPEEDYQRLLNNIKEFKEV